LASVLPPHLTEPDLARALDAFTAAVGSDAVLTGAAALREFRDPFAFERATAALRRG
jgi:hypothetical protein